MSELSRRSGVPIATIKFYLREGLLPEGRRTAATQAQYGEEHVARLGLVRALLGPGQLSVATARKVLGQVGSDREPTHDLLGEAQSAVTPPAPPGVDLTRVHALMRRWGWAVDDDCSDNQAMLLAALEGVDAAEFALADSTLDRYASAVFDVAEAEIDGVPIGSPAEAVRYVVLGTVLLEPVLLALRRLAQEEASRRRFRQGSPDGS